MARKQKEKPVEVDEPKEILLDETVDYLITIETYPDQSSMTGVRQGYGCLNKMTGVIELRFGCYSEAIQGILMLQDQYDKHMAVYKQKMGMLN